MVVWQNSKTRQSSCVTARGVPVRPRPPPPPPKVSKMFVQFFVQNFVHFLLGGVPPGAPPPPAQLRGDTPGPPPSWGGGPPDLLRMRAVTIIYLCNRCIRSIRDKIPEYLCIAGSGLQWVQLLRYLARTAIPFPSEKEQLPWHPCLKKGL